MNDRRVIDLATEAHRRGLLLVITREGRTRLRRYLRPGDQRIAVRLKEAA